MKRKIFIALLALAVFFVPISLSCTEKGGGSENSGSPTADDGSGGNGTGTESHADALPKENYGGYVFKIIGRHGGIFLTFPEEEETGDPVNDALYNRNRATEEYFNVKIKNIDFSDQFEISQNVKNSVNAQDGAYDMVLNSLTNGLGTIAPQGLLYDLNSMDHLRPDEEWWCKSLYDDMQVNGRIFYSAGPICPFFYDAPFVCAYNKTLAADLDMGNINQLALNGEWTAGRLSELIKDANRDINGNGKMDREDFFGLASDPTVGTALAFAFGQKMTIRDDERHFKLNFESEAMVNAVNLCADIILDKTSSYNGAVTHSEAYEEVTPFKDNRVIFLIVPMGVVDIYLRDMKDDYGIIPLPKLDSSQDKYYSYGLPFGPVGAGVPVYCDAPERTGLIMEMMAQLSHDMVRPAKYDNLLRQKVARDEESQQMLDLIFSNIYFDLNEIQNFGGSRDLVNNVIYGGRGDFVSGYEKIKDKAEKDIQELVDAYLSLE